MRAVLSKPIPPTVCRVAAAIVLGAATTVAVAWLLALCVDGRHGGVHRWRGFRYEVASQVIPTPPQSPQQTGLHFASATRTRRWGTDIVRVSATWADDPDHPPYGSPHALVEGASFAAEMKEKFDRGEAPPTAWWRGDGWPLPALSAEARWRGSGGDTAFAVGGVLVGSDQVSMSDGVRILPLQPIWSGLVINTVLYVSLWFALFSLGGIRSRLRRRRGQCVRCGYKLLREQARCSECGERVL